MLHTLHSTAGECRAKPSPVLSYGLSEGGTLCQYNVFVLTSWDGPCPSHVRCDAALRGCNLLPRARSVSDGEQPAQFMGSQKEAGEEKPRESLELKLTAK